MGNATTARRGGEPHPVAEDPRARQPERASTTSASRVSDEAICLGRNGESGGSHVIHPVSVGGSVRWRTPLGVLFLDIQLLVLGWRQSHRVLRGASPRCRSLIQCRTVLGVLEAREAAPVDQLRLERREPRFGHRIVVRVAARPDGGSSADLVDRSV